MAGMRWHHREIGRRADQKIDWELRWVTRLTVHLSFMGGACGMLPCDRIPSMVGESLFE